MPKFKSNDIAELAHQLTLSPRRQRLAQIAGAEKLLELIESGRDYPYDFVCFHLTGYRPLKPSGKSTLQGEGLISDLVRLIEHLSQTSAIPVAALRGVVHTQEELSQRLSVSTKTIARWRQRGLSGWRVLDADRVSRLVFTERALQRFVARNRDLVLRGGAFKQLSATEREGIIERCREILTERRCRLQEVARTIAEETGRAVETIRYTLRRYDRESSTPLFGTDGRPSVPESYTEIYRLSQSGMAAPAIAERFAMSAARVRRICNEMRAYGLHNRKLTCVYHPEFDLEDAEARILDSPEPEATEVKTTRAPSGAPAYLKALYRVPLLTAEQERDLFRRYNYCKHRATQLIDALEPCKASAAALDAIDAYMCRADAYQQRLIKANLRLVVNIANRHLRNGNLFELVSDGNMSLMRAVERFDYARGFKFSTYASWAIMKNFARTVPEARNHYSRYVTGREEVLDSASDAAAAPVDATAESEGVRSALERGLQQLSEREREILACHYGLGRGDDRPVEPTTLEQLGQRFGVTKERIRQIEKRALDKLRGLLPQSLADYSS